MMSYLIYLNHYLMVVLQVRLSLRLDVYILTGLAVVCDIYLVVLSFRA